jgi:CRP/FNR family nitrogen fixation transcriptional regulator
MFVRTTTNSSPHETSLNDLGITTASNPHVTLSEFAYARGTEIYGESEPATYVYQVKVGAVRSYKLLSDGRRQIGAFHLPGDIFGLENADMHRFTAEAVVDTTVRIVKGEALTEWLKATLLSRATYSA